MAAKLYYPDGLRVVLFASGRGSNAEALMELADREERFHVEALASDQAQAPVIKKAQKRGIKTIVNERTRGQTKLDYENLWIEKLNAIPHNFALLCGYMKILGPTFLNYYWDPKPSLFRLINIHPSLLPAYPGLNSYQRAFENNDKKGGVTLHLVDEGVDSGAILKQESFERQESDSLESFKKRGLELEHKLYPQLVQTLIHEGVEIKR